MPIKEEIPGYVKSENFSIKMARRGVWESAQRFLISSNNFPIESHHEHNNKRTIYLEKENGKIK